MGLVYGLNELKFVLEADMERLMETVRGLTLSHFTSGEFKLAPEDLQAFLSKGGVVVDLRTDEEVGLVKLGFAKHIPLHELPDRLDEIPKDKTVALFCSGKLRSPMAYLFLKTLGYDVRILDLNLEGLGALFGKPGFALKLAEAGVVKR